MCQGLCPSLCLQGLDLLVHTIGPCLKKPFLSSQPVEPFVLRWLLDEGGTNRGRAHPYPTHFQRVQASERVVGQLFGEGGCSVLQNLADTWATSDAVSGL